MPQYGTRTQIFRFGMPLNIKQCFYGGSARSSTSIISSVVSRSLAESPGYRRQQQVQRHVGEDEITHVWTGLVPGRICLSPGHCVVNWLLTAAEMGSRENLKVGTNMTKIWPGAAGGG